MDSWRPMGRHGARPERPPGLAYQAHRGDQRCGGVDRGAVSVTASFTLGNDPQRCQRRHPK